jgi:response regulator receiver domain-containing protein
VLVIDDKRSVRLALARFFARGGWEVRQAEDGSEALELLADPAASAYQIVITDLRMPGRTGVEVDVASPSIREFIRRTTRPGPREAVRARCRRGPRPAGHRKALRRLGAAAQLGSPGTAMPIAWKPLST